MTRLINPGVGELCDRLSILNLKILHGELAGKATTHFEEEAAAITTQIDAHGLPAHFVVFYSRLAAINAALWQAEDQLRDLREAGLSLNSGTLAFRIQDLNDRRARAIELINRETQTYVGAEKL